MVYVELVKSGLSEKGKGLKWLQSAIAFLNSKPNMTYYEDCSLGIAMNNVCGKLHMRYSFDKQGVWTLYK